jgi:hypothetical protein
MQHLYICIFMSLLANQNANYSGPNSYRHLICSIMTGYQHPLYKYYNLMCLQQESQTQTVPASAGMPHVIVSNKQGN